MDKVVPQFVRVKMIVSLSGDEDDAFQVQADYWPPFSDLALVESLVDSFSDDAWHVMLENLGQWFDVPLDGFPELIGGE